MTAHWTLEQAWPADWKGPVHALGGSFFHTPMGVSAAGAQGDPFTAVYRDGAQILGWSLGAVRQCTLARSARHLYLPTLPLLAASVRRTEALRALRTSLAASGIAEVQCDSFDGGWVSSPSETGGRPLPPRCEYLVRLDDAGTLCERFRASHRRMVRRGTNSGWTLRRLSPATARAVLTEVTQRAADRRDPSAQGAPELPRLLTCDREPDPAFGIGAFAAFAGEIPLTAGWFGWAGGRMFYVLGGSTDAGYRASAAAWFHARMMHWFAALGGSVYNLGGVSAEGEEGLHRFKRGFGAEREARGGFQWTISATHIGTHRAAHAMAVALGLR